MNTIGERLRAERNRIGLSQEKFAEFCGIKKLTQLNYEGGKSSPDAEYLVKVSELGVDTQYILTGKKTINESEMPKKTNQEEAANDSLSNEKSEVLRMFDRLDEKARQDFIYAAKKLVENCEERRESQRREQEYRRELMQTKQQFQQFAQAA